MPSRGVNFYRLKVARENQAQFYSKTLILKDADKPIVLELFPVPFMEQLNIGIDLPVAESVQINLLNSEGKLVQDITVKANEGANTIQLNDLESILPGLYIIKVKINENIFIKKAFKL